MREPDRALSWREQLEGLAHEYRRVLLAYRDGARVVSSIGGPSGPNRLRLTEIVLRTLLDAGFEHKDAAYAGFLLNDYVTNFVSEESQYMDVEEESDVEASWSGVQEWVETLPPSEYPSVIALAGHLIGADVDERFRFGIEILGDGLEDYLARRKSGR